MAETATPETLSAKDISDLRKIRSMLPAGDPRIAKIDALTGRQKVDAGDVQQGPLPSGQDPQQIIQEMTGVHPFKNPAGQAAMGPVRAVGGLLKSPWDIGKSFFTGPQNPEEAQLEYLGGRPELVAKRMLIDPSRAALEQSSGLQQESRQLLETSRFIEANAGTEEGRRMLKQRFPQMNFNTEKDAREQASGLRWRSIRTYGSKVLSDVQSIPFVGGMARMGGERWAAGDPVGAFTETAANAVLMADPHIPGTKMTVNEALISKPVEYSLQRARMLPEGFRRFGQSAMGVGPDMTRRKVRDETRRFLVDEPPEVAKRNADKLEKHQKEVDQANEDHQKKVQAYNETVDTINRDNQEKTDAHRQEVKRTVQEHRDLQQAHSDWQGVEGERTVLESQILHDVKETEARIRQKAGDKYDALREKMGDASVPGAQMLGAVEKARKLLRGSKESIKQFNEIASQVTGKESEELATMNSAAQNLGHADFNEMWQGLGENARQNWRNSFGDEVIDKALAAQTVDVDWNTLQGFKEELADKISPGKAYLLGDIYKAVENLHDSIAGAMDDLAKERGLTEQYNDAKSYYRKFKMTFDKDWGKSGSASPIAESANAVDPVNAGKPLLSPGADMHPAMRDLRDFDPALADRIQRYQQNAKIKAPSKAPLEAGPRSYQELATNPELAGGGKFAEQAPKKPDLKDPGKVPVPEPKKTDPFKPEEVKQPEVDMQRLKEESLEATAKGSERVGPGSMYYWALTASSGLSSILAHVAGVPGGATWGAIFGPLSIEVVRRYATTKMDMPGVVKFLSKPSRADVEYLGELAKLSPEAAAKVAEQIKRLQGQAKAPIKIHPDVARFLAQAGVASRGAKTSSGEQRARDLVRQIEKKDYAYPQP